MKYTKKQIELLRKASELPAPPCKGGCIGAFQGFCEHCKKWKDYKKEMEPFEKAKILLEASNLRKYHELSRELETLKEKLKDVLNQI